MTTTIDGIASYILEKINGHDVAMSQHDGVNITMMLNASGVEKKYKHWNETKLSERQIVAVSKSTNIPVDKLIITIKGGADEHARGTWAHPYIAMYVAMWADVDFGQRMMTILMRFLSGDITLVKDVVDRHDQLNNSVTDVAIVGGDTKNITKVIVQSQHTTTVDQEDRNEKHAAIDRSIRSIPDYSKKYPQLPSSKKDVESGRPRVRMEDIDTNPVNAFRAFKVILTKDTDHTYYDVCNKAVMRMLQMYNEIERLREKIETMDRLANEPLSSSDDDSDSGYDSEASYKPPKNKRTGPKVCSRCRVCSKCTEKNNHYKTVAEQLRVKVDALSLLIAAKIEKMDPQTAKSATTAFARASAAVPESDLPLLGNAVAQSSLFAAHSKEGAVIKKTLYNVLGLLIYSAADCENPNKPYNKQHERMYITRDDDDDEREYFNIHTLSKLAGKVDKNTREAAYRLAMLKTNTLPISMPPIVKDAIEVYYGATSFAPYFWPSGESEYGRDVMIYLSRGPLVQPVNHHLVYGGRIMTTNVTDTLQAIEAAYPNSIWKNNVNIPATIYTIDCRMEFMRICSSLSGTIASFVRNDRGSWSTL
jgi:hypothetical protein